MYRRRRQPERAILFSFDSFLDLVANVIGIVVRLILVAWVGSRVYKGPQMPPPPPMPEVQVAAFVPPPADEASGREVQRLQAELARSRQVTLEALRTREASRQAREQAERQTAQLKQQREELQRKQPDLASTLATQKQADVETAQSVRQLRERHASLQSDLEALKKAPRETKQLAYRSPVSAAVQTEEVFFECHQGRVTLIDVATLLDDVRAHMQENGKQLRSTWTVQETTRPQGAFRLRYTLERERGLLEGTGQPNNDGAYRYGLSRWVVEPVKDDRGEPADAALKAGSDFRKIVDRLDPKQVVVTLWVYPDSFGVYRKLRDYLHDRAVVVAGRPLPEGVAIASSRSGSTSRGQ